MKLLVTATTMVIILLTCNAVDAQRNGYYLSIYAPVTPQDVVNTAEARQKVVDLFIKENDLKKGKSKAEKITSEDNIVVFYYPKETRKFSFREFFDALVISKGVIYVSPDQKAGPASLRMYKQIDAFQGEQIFEIEGDFEYLKKIADYLWFIYKTRMKEELREFEPIAAKYRESSIKPQMSEEQRKYIVQANAFSQEKNYTEAINKNLKAVELNQTAFPAAYSNLALLSAQIQKYEDAIFYMTKYLMLVPDAEDARSAQDKIYEWESKNGNN
jgi:tetratricopeptide (TPR) repeat protein